MAGAQVSVWNQAGMIAALSRDTLQNPLRRHLRALAVCRLRLHYGVPALLNSTPARLTALASTKLPRLALIALGVVYIVAGLFMRDPWKTDDVVGVATMLTALQDGAWLLPHIGPLAYVEDGPLTVWAGALAVWLAGSVIGELAAVRLPNLLWFGATAWGVWYGTYLLGWRPEAQPLALPFGGGPSVRAYGRLLADVALLLLIATAGILWRTHETSSIPASMACQALAYYALARMLDRPVGGAAVLGLALAGAFLNRGWPGVLPLLLALPWLCQSRSPLWPVRRWLIAALALGTALSLCWWLPASQADGGRWMEDWQIWHAAFFGVPTFESWMRALRDMSWFLWPTWPLALLAVWRWRAWLTAPHVLLPGALAIGMLAQIALTRSASEPDFILLVVPGAVLAAFAMPTLRRGVVNTLDWFALMCFSLTAATVWLGWIAQHFGWPRKIAGNIARQTTGFVPEVSWIALALALVVTLAWIALVGWRLRSRPAVLWRGAVLLAGGLTTTWLLLALLWLPAVDYARSYRTVSGQLAEALQQEGTPGECLRSLGLGKGQRAAFRVFDNISFEYGAACPLLLQQTTRSAIRNGTAGYSDADVDVVWQGARVTDRSELFRLIRLKPKRQEVSG